MIMVTTHALGEANEFDCVRKYTKQTKQNLIWSGRRQVQTDLLPRHAR